MIDDKLVDNIRAYGTYKDSGEGRRRVLVENIGFRIGERAEHVIITGCIQPEGMPHVFRALKDLLDYFQVDYTLLSKEYCCSWVPLGQPAVMAKNEEDITKAKELSRDFILENFRQAEALGAKSIVLFCAACEPNYANYAGATNLEVISYSELLNRYFNGGKLYLEVSYYPGCYRFRRRITEKPLDTEPALRLLNKIEGLSVNHLDSKLCCYIQPHLEQLIAGLTTRTLITICTGCYYNLRSELQERGDCQVKMLPEVVLEAARSE
ncbi:MAG TPA: (Fe-S)-binding protein [Dehalococcoidia bacterium]|nr:(Fe-S)-binding protein [Dehalococcoidia bacterium]